MECMLFTFENKSSAHTLGGVSDVAFFINTDEQLQSNWGCYFPIPDMLPEGFPFYQFNWTGEPRNAGWSDHHHMTSLLIQCKTLELNYICKMF